MENSSRRGENRVPQAKNKRTDERTRAGRVASSTSPNKMIKTDCERTVVAGECNGKDGNRGVSRGAGGAPVEMANKKILSII